jgi:hypothetical protein
MMKMSFQSGAAVNDAEEAIEAAARGGVVGCRLVECVYVRAC